MRGRDFLTAILDNLRQIRGSGVAPAPSMSFADAGEAVVSLLSAVEAASAQRAPDMRKVSAYMRVRMRISFGSPTSFEYKHFLFLPALVELL